MQIRFGDDVRRVFITTDGIDFAKLAALLRSKFQCQDDVLIIKYVDDESDLVTKGLLNSKKVYAFLKSLGIVPGVASMPGNCVGLARLAWPGLWQRPY